MDDVMISKLIIQENVKEENEKIKEEDEKNKTTEIILNERMSLNTQRNLSLINRARLKILKDNFYKNRNKIKNNNYENIESPKKENEGIFFTEPNIPIKKIITKIFLILKKIHIKILLKIQLIKFKKKEIKI